MATFLTRMVVKPGCEVDFERTAAALHDASHENEPRLLRYEYWRGSQERTYYTLASFEDFNAFLEHQISEHHETLAKDLVHLAESMSFEWVDPIASASPLPPTDMQPLSAAASELEATYNERFAVRDGDWWQELRQGG